MGTALVVWVLLSIPAAMWFGAVCRTSDEMEIDDVGVL